MVSTTTIPPTEARTYRTDTDTDKLSDRELELELELEHGVTKFSIDTITSRLHIALYPAQKEIVYCPLRRLLITGGERAGKSFVSSVYAVTRVPYGSLFWIVGPDYEQARSEFDYIVQMLGELGAFATQRSISQPKVGKCRADLKSGQIIETKSSDEVMKLASRAPDGIIMSEAAQQSYESYLKCVGRVAEKRGWLLMSGTLEGSENWYPELFNEWAVSRNPEDGISFSLPSWGNTSVYPGGRNDPEILNLERAYRKVPGFFEERIAATPVPPTGLVFREFRSSVHVTNDAKFDARYPVYLAVDPSGGGAPYSVLACQFKICTCPIPEGERVAHKYDKIEDCFIIDEIYETSQLGDTIMDTAKKRIWWSSVRGGAIDVEAPDEKLRWLTRCKVNLKAEKVPQLHGIRRLHTFLHYTTDPITGQYTDAPHLHMHPRVSSLPYEFMKYKRRDPAEGFIITKDEPPSAQPNHSIKALWYLLIARYGYVKGNSVPKPAYNWHPVSSLSRLNLGIPDKKERVRMVRGKWGG